MPELDYAVLGDYVRAEHGIAHVIAAGVDTITADQVPTASNLGLLIRLTFTRAECGRPHRVEVTIQDTDGKRIAELKGTMVPDRQEGLPPGWRQGAMTALNFGIVFPTYGLYSIEVIVNDNSVKSIDLRVVPPQDMGPSLPGEGEGSGSAD